MGVLLERAAEEVLSLSDSAAPEKTALLLNRLVELSYRLGRNQLTVRAAERLLAIRERTQSGDEKLLAHAQYVLALAKARLGDHRAAAEALGLALPVYEKNRPPNDADLLYLRRRLAYELEMLGDLEGALEQPQILVAACQDLPEEHGSRLEALEGLAVKRMLLAEDLLDVLHVQEECLAPRLRTLPEEDPAVVRLLFNMANTVSRLGDRGCHPNTWTC